MPDPKIEDPGSYSSELPIHLAIYAHNGMGKTSLAGNTGLRTLLLDSGAITLRHVSRDLLKIVRIKSILHYLDVIEWAIRHADDFDLLVPDTTTGLQAIAIREVKGKRTFEMNQRKWGTVSSKVMECLNETRNFPKDVIYLVQERSKEDESGVEEINPGLTPSVRGYLSSVVDWVGRISLNEEGRRTLDFRITDKLEVKDRAGLFPKLIVLPEHKDNSKVNPSYAKIRQRIFTELQGGS
jgi:hypothetical protein